MKNLPMDLLRTFVTIVQLNSFTKAGEILGRSQPAISLQMRRLEELLDETLLIRDGKHMMLSELGERFYPQAEKILLLNDRAISQFSKNNVVGKVRLGIPSEFATVLLPKIVSRFVKAYPNVTLEVNCELSKDLLSKAGRTHYDVILALQNNPRETTDKWVKTDDLVWVTSPDHNVHKLPVVPLIVAPEGCIYRNRAIANLDSTERPWQIIYTIPDLTGIQYAIQEGLGMTVLAKSTVPKNLRIIEPSSKLTDLGKVEISVTIAVSHNENKAAHLLSDFLGASLA